MCIWVTEILSNIFKDYNKNLMHLISNFNNFFYL